MRSSTASPSRMNFRRMATPASRSRCYRARVMHATPHADEATVAFAAGMRRYQSTYRSSSFGSCFGPWEAAAAFFCSAGTAGWPRDAAQRLAPVECRDGPARRDDSAIRLHLAAQMHAGRGRRPLQAAWHAGLLDRGTVGESRLVRKTRPIAAVASRYCPGAPGGALESAGRRRARAARKSGLIGKTGLALHARLQIAALAGRDSADPVAAVDRVVQAGTDPAVIESRTVRLTLVD
jgi:hypothetical protein